MNRNINKSKLHYFLLILSLIILNSCSQNKNDKLNKEYENLINTPYVIHIQALINKLNSTEKLPKCTETSIPGINPVACEKILQAVQHHPQSKFLIINGSRAMGGGMTFNLAFQEPLDSVYYVWVYKQGDDSFQIRAFDRDEKSSEQIKAFFEDLKKRINIEKYWL